MAVNGIFIVLTAIKVNFSCATLKTLVNRNIPTCIYRLRQRFIFPTILAFSCNSWAHEDFDLGIQSLAFSNACQPMLTVKNFGSRALPKTFYLAQNPAYIELRKDGAKPLVINSKSLSLLDTKKSLKQPGGQLHMEVPESFVANPAPLQARLMVQGEFWDYGQKNDTAVLAEDCVVGKGGKPGHALPQGPADLALTVNSINGCSVEFTITNLNQGIIQADAFGQDSNQSIVISPYNNTTQTRLPPILLKDLDKKKSLLTGKAKVKLTLPNANYTLSLWQAKDDGDFSNNHQSVAINSCIH